MPNEEHLAKLQEGVWAWNEWWQKKLSWQSWLAEELFEPAEVGSGIAAEPRPQHAGVPTALEAGAHLAPARPIGAGEIAGVPAAQPGGQTGEEPHRAAPHRRRARGLAARRPPLVAAVRPEQPLEPVVGARRGRGTGRAGSCGSP